MAQIDAFFKLMNDQGASDLHLVAGQQPVLRIQGDLERVKYKELDNDGLKAMLYEIATEEKVKVFEETGDVDFAYWSHFRLENHPLTCARVRSTSGRGCAWPTSPCRVRCT